MAQISSEIFTRRVPDREISRMCETPSAVIATETDGYFSSLTFPHTHFVSKDIL